MYLKGLLFVAIAATISGCTKENDYDLQDFTSYLFYEDFSKNPADNTTLDTPGWINYNETGSMKWKEQVYQHNPYAEFTSFQSNDDVNIGWLISPSINMDLYEGEKLTFETAMAYVTSGSNSIEVLISTNFDDTNSDRAAAIAAANWETLSANLPGTNATYFEFLPSGVIDLSGYTGNIHLAYKVKGSGNNTALDGSYQVDNIRITYNQ